MTKKIVKKTILTLGDVYALMSGSTVTRASISDLPTLTETLINKGFSSALLSGKEDKLNTLFSTYLLPQAMEEDVVECEEGEEDDESLNLLGLLLYHALKGYDKYSLIIDRYEATKVELVDTVDDLVSENVSKFNDTPQEEGNYTADEYTSSINQSTTTSTNPAKKSNLDKLVLLQEKLKNTYQIWSNEIFRAILI